MDDRTIYANGGEWADQRAISVEIDPFYDGFWLRNTANDVPSVRGEQVRAPQSVHAARRQQSPSPGLRSCGARRAERHCCGNQAYQRTREE